MLKRYFITGIGTNVGKTVASAIITQALHADYWKPIQTGELEKSDSIKIRTLINNNKSKIHSERYLLKQPISPHAAAKKEGVSKSDIADS